MLVCRGYVVLTYVELQVQGHLRKSQFIGIIPHVLNRDCCPPVMLVGIMDTISGMSKIEPTDKVS